MAEGVEGSGEGRIRESTTGSSPISTFVPWLSVTGRSVLARNVKHGTPSAEASSWTPPESVTMAPAAPCSDRKSTYPAGSMQRTPAASRRVRPDPASSRARVRGWIGKTTGASSAMPTRPSTMFDSWAGSSTFEGRWSVTSTYSCGFTPSGRQASRTRACGSSRRSESIIVLPT